MAVGNRWITENTLAGDCMFEEEEAVMMVGK